MSPVPRHSVLLDLEHEVAVLMRRIKKVVAERARTIHADLAPAAYLMLAYLVEKGPMRSSTIVDAFDLDKGAVSRHIHTLVELDLATKERDPDDGRAWVVTPTEEARQRVAALVEARREKLGQLLEGWSEEDLTEFVSTLGRYNSTLD